jgi:hypothetical protein
MSKPNTNLENLIPSRIASRTAATPGSDSQPVARYRQPSRTKTIMIAGHFDPDVSYAIHELCGKLTRQRSERVTVQQALAEALADWFKKHGALPPEGLNRSIIR